MTIKDFVSTLTVIALTGLVHAGPSANVNACIYLPVEPSRNYTINFKAGAGTDACMPERGHDAPILVDRKGVICTSVGVVRAKAGSSNGDTCATDQSHWGLSWQTEDKKESGSTNSRWYRSDWIVLHGHSPNTYIIFEPSSFTLTTPTSPEDVEQALLAAYGQEL
ncbi:hypothetical protein IFR05_003012 [Cadophora sp. M221]|nr:hypothetical protein IFR05_003012 [Cadophora sp. M221]